MFRFLAFIFGIFVGAVASLTFLPFPGKTFFNRMSKLPKGTKDLIDNSLGLFVSFSRLSVIVTKEASDRLSRALDVTQKRLEEVNKDYYLNSKTTQISTKAEEKEEEQEKVAA